MACLGIQKVTTLVEHIYDSDQKYTSASLLYKEEGEILFTHASSELRAWDQNGSALQIKPWPLSTYITLTIRLQGRVTQVSGTLVGPCHILTSCEPLREEDRWAEEITASGNFKVTKAYTFSEWIQEKNPLYDIALLILNKPLGHYTGWSGLLSVPDNYLIEQELYTLQSRHTIQRVSPDQLTYTQSDLLPPKGSTVSTRMLATSMIVGLHTEHKGNPVGIRISDSKLKALAQKIAENFFSTLLPIAFGKAEWATYFGDIGEEPSLPPNIFEILNAPCPIWPDKRIHETHLLTLIPNAVNGELLTLEVLGKIVKNPHKGNGSKFGYIDLTTMWTKFEDKPVSKSHWTLLSKDIIPDKEIARYPGYEQSNILDTAVSVFMEYVRNGNRLFGKNNPRVYIKCKEQWGFNMPVIIGDFNENGPTLGNEYDYFRLNKDLKWKSGLAGQRVLSS